MHPALHTFDLEQLKKLRSTSHTLYWLAFLWGFSGLVVAYLGERMISAQGEDVSLGTFLMFYGLAIAVVGPYSAWARPAWGRFACMALCLPPLANFSYEAVAGIFSLFALLRAWPLFGDDRVGHEELDAAIRARQR